MAQTDILEYIRKTPHNSNVNVVKGMLNAEGGGGSSDLKNKMLSITIINNSGQDLSEAMPLQLFTNDNGLVKVDAVNWPTIGETINANSLIVPSPDGLGGEIFIVEMQLPDPTQGAYSISASNSVNCTLNSGFLGDVLEVTDLTKDASATLTVTIS